MKKEILGALLFMGSFAVEHNQARAQITVLSPQAGPKFKSLVANPSSIVGVELIKTLPGKSLESRFGHLLLRLIDNDSDSLNDVVFNFFPDYGNNGSPMFSALPAFNMGLEIQPMRYFVESYVAKENRSLTRFALLTTAPMRAALAKQLKIFVDQPQERGKYTALGNSCIGIINRALRQAGILGTSDNVVRPSRTDSFYNRIGLSPYPKRDINPGSKKDMFDSATRFPVILYKYCQDQSCGDSLLKTLRAHYGQYFSLNELNRSIDTHKNTRSADPSLAQSMSGHYLILEAALERQGF